MVDRDLFRFWNTALFFSIPALCRFRRLQRGDALRHRPQNRFLNFHRRSMAAFE